jgi:osmoprotectant transport system substrate-binding protein
MMTWRCTRAPHAARTTWARARAILARGLLALVAIVGPVGCQPNLRQRMPITVASSKTREQLVLGHMTVLVLEAAGYRVVNQVGLGDEWAVRRALEVGKVDMVWAYTGDVWSRALGRDLPITNPGELYRRVRDEDRLRGVSWLSPTPCDRTPGLVMPEAVAESYNISTISDLARVLARTDPNLRLCVPEWFRLQDAGGLRGLEQVYSLGFRPDAMRTLGVEESYDALKAGEAATCDCALGYSNDVAVIGGGLHMLRDDRRFFQTSTLAVGVRTATLQEFPELQQHLSELTQILTGRAMADLYRQTAIEGEDPKRAAERFLREHDLIGRGRRGRS